MSQSYVIRVTTSVCVPAGEQSDRITRRVVPPLRGLSAEDQADLLASALARRPAWRSVGEGVFVRERGQLVERLDARTGELEVSGTNCEATLEVAGEVSVPLHAAPDVVTDRIHRRTDALRETARTELARSEAARQAAQRELAGGFEATEAERVAELEELVREVTAAGLKLLAGRLGRVTACDEQLDDGSYELVIRVELPD